MEESTPIRIRCHGIDSKRLDQVLNNLKKNGLCHRFWFENIRQKKVRVYAKR